MSRTVTIPNFTQPKFVCVINNKIYEYTAGTTTSVPNEVAALIEAINAETPQESGKNAPDVPKPSIADENKTIVVDGNGRYALGNIVPDPAVADAGKFIGVDDSGQYILTSHEHVIYTQYLNGHDVPSVDSTNSALFNDCFRDLQHTRVFDYMSAEEPDEPLLRLEMRQEYTALTAINPFTLNIMLSALHTGLQCTVYEGTGDGTSPDDVEYYANMIVPNLTLSSMPQSGSTMYGIGRDADGGVCMLVRLIFSTADL